MHKEIGNKAIALNKLKSIGFKVPKFLSFNSDISLKTVLKVVRDSFPENSILAVRSSSGQEDGKEQSFAGAFHTELGVKIKDLETAWNKVKKSFDKNSNDGIIIQEFIPGDYSGVAFADSNLKRISINALSGICKSIVDGWDCEHYDYYDKLLINKHTKPSYQCIEYLKGTFYKKEIRTQDRTDVLKKIVNLSYKITDYFSEPQDIEWTFYKQEVYILQSRPISRALWTIDNKKMLFDSANIGESYSGIVYPLTSSFAKNIYLIVYKDLLRESGVSKNKIKKNNKVFKALVENVYGRMFYRMDNWYKMMAMLPGYQRNSKNLKNMLSLNFKENLEIKQYSPSLFLRINYFPKVLFKFIFFNKTMLDFKKQIEKLIEESSSWNYDKMSLKQSQKKIKYLMNGILRKWYLTIENDTVMMTLYGYLTKSKTTTELKSILEFPSVSTEQINLLCILSRKLCQSRQIKFSLKTKNSELFNKELEKDSAIKFQYENYLKKFGGRFANELKLETNDINEDFDTFSDLVLAYSKKEITSKVKKSIKGSYLETLFKKFASRREDFRLLRANMFAIMRKLSMRIGNCYYEKGFIDEKEDVFFLDLEDIDGDNAIENINFSIIEKRKREYSFFKTLNPPPFFKVENNKWPSFTESKSKIQNKGIGASPGQIIGKALVLENFEIPDENSFDILVTRRTDPGWTALMALSKGIVVEHGGILSHASIVARELEIPAVIGINKACQRFKTGDLLFIDGEKGIVREVSK